MFDIGWTELLLVAILAIVLFRPSDLPQIMRKLGQWAGKLRRFVHDMQSQFRSAMDEADLGDVNSAFDEVRKLRELSPRHQLAKALQDKGISTEKPIMTAKSKDTDV